MDDVDDVDDVDDDKDDNANLYVVNTHMVILQRR